MIHQLSPCSVIMLPFSPLKKKKKLHESHTFFKLLSPYTIARLYIKW